MKHIKTNSKLIKKKDIFICTHDKLLDRHKYIKDAINKKASAIIIDKNINIKTNIPLIKVKNTNDVLFETANNYYNNPLNKIKLIGITGTDGKTSTAYLTKELLEIFIPCAYLGTNGFIIKNKTYKTKNTTPNITEILKYMNIAIANECKYLIMEVSSEGLLHNRCNNLIFKEVVLTNIAKDHLNIHKTFNNYLNSKLELFKKVNNESINIINIDDKYYNNFKNTNNCKTITYGKNKKANFNFNNIKLKKDKTEFNLNINNKTYKINSPLIGKFNVYNLVCAIAIVNNLNINIKDIIDKIKYIKPVKGRTTYIKNNLNYNIILDYAHTTQATKEILTFINNITTNNIITVVGCAGNRYQEKRKEIGKLVSDLSTKAIFTMDDPRNEKIENIFKDMCQNTTKNNIKLIKNRKKAIKYAFKIAKENDYILILGKGEDNYMAIKNKYKNYSDLQTIKKILKKKKTN